MLTSDVLPVKETTMSSLLRRSVLLPVMVFLIVLAIVFFIA
jgi:hypothetical protein